MTLSILQGRSQFYCTKVSAVNRYLRKVWIHSGLNPETLRDSYVNGHPAYQGPIWLIIIF